MYLARENQTQTANLESIGTVLLSVALGAAGQLLIKAAVNQIGQLEFTITTLLRLASSPLLILALGIYGVSAILWLLALRRAELSFTYPFLSLTYVAVLIGGAILFREQVTLARLIGFVVIIIGLVIIARSEAQPGKVPDGTNSEVTQ